MLTDRLYAYADGQSHYIRSECAWRELHGPNACLHDVRLRTNPSERLRLVIPKAKVFWTQNLSAGAKRIYYFTTADVDQDANLRIQKTLRDFGLTSVLCAESAEGALRRAALLNQHNLIEKANGLDIKLAVQMLEDASFNSFDICHLYSSDDYFLPVIEAIRRRGKQVYVFGRKDVSLANSAFHHVPDLFTDIKDVLREQCVLASNSNTL